MLSTHVSQTDPEADASSKLIGQRLCDAGLVQPEDLDKALAMQSASGGRIGSALIRIGALSEENLLNALSEQLNVPVLEESELPELNELYRFMINTGLNFEWYLAQEVLVWPLNESAVCCVARDILNPMIDEVMDRFFAGKQIEFRLIASYAYEEIASNLERE